MSLTSLAPRFSHRSTRKVKELSFISRMAGWPAVGMLSLHLLASAVADDQVSNSGGNPDPDGNRAQLLTLVRGRNAALEHIAALARDGADDLKMAEAKGRLKELNARTREFLEGITPAEGGGREKPETHAGISADISPLVEEFLSKRRSLLRTEVRELKQLLSISSAADRHAALLEFRQFTAAYREGLQGLAAEMAEEARDATALPEKPVIPDGASPAARLLIEDRHRRMLEQAEYVSRVQNIPPEQRQEATDSWQRGQAGETESIDRASDEQ